MSVLAHVVLNGAMQSEPAAMQALAHILNASRDMAGAIVGILREAGIEFEPGWVQAELGHEDSRPDLTVRDNEGFARVLVENKFWAGLTEAQPVSYLGDLPEDGSGALLFIVPLSRLPSVPYRYLNNRHRKPLQLSPDQQTAQHPPNDLSPGYSGHLLTTIRIRLNTW